MLLRFFAISKVTHWPLCIVFGSSLWIALRRKKTFSPVIASDEAGAYLLVEPFYLSRRHGLYPPFSGDVKSPHRAGLPPARENSERGLRFPLPVDAKLMQLPTEGNKE